MEQVRARIEQRSRPVAGPADEPEGASAAAVLPPTESFGFDDGSIYRSSRGRGVGRALYRVRMLLAPFVKLIVNVDPMVDALARQARRNAEQASFDDDAARRLAALEERDELTRRAVHGLTAEVTRLAADMRDQRGLLEAVAEVLVAQAKRSARPASLDDDAARRSAAGQEPDEATRAAVQRLTTIMERLAAETKNRRTPPEAADEPPGAAFMERLAAGMKNRRTPPEAADEPHGAALRARTEENDANPPGPRSADESAPATETPAPATETPAPATETPAPATETSPPDR